MSFPLTLSDDPNAGFKVTALFKGNYLHVKLFCRIVSYLKNATF